MAVVFVFPTGLFAEESTNQAIADKVVEITEVDEALKSGFALALARIWEQHEIDTDSIGWMALLDWQDRRFVLATVTYDKTLGNANMVLAEWKGDGTLDIIDADAIIGSAGWLAETRPDIDVAVFTSANKLAREMPYRSDSLDEAIKRLDNHIASLEASKREASNKEMREYYQNLLNDIYRPLSREFKVKKRQMEKPL